MRNVEVAWVFQELADLLELKGEEFFKIRAYKNASRILAGLEEPLEDIWKSGRLEKIPGIGRNIAAKVAEILSTGRLKKHEELLKEVPLGLLDIMSLPGIGPKKAGMIYERLGVFSLDGLARAAKEGRVRDLPGMSGKSEKEIIRYIELKKDRGGRVLLAMARDLFMELSDYIKMLPGVVRVEVGGSVRRWQETVGDIDLVAAASDPQSVFDAVATHPRVREVVEKDQSRARFQTYWGITVDLEVVPEEAFVPALFFCTGSHAHLRRLQSFLAGKGANLDPASIANVCREPLGDEREVYASIGLPYIPPELREDRGEVEAASEHRLPDLLELGDIKGDLHIHTSWSDGLCTIEQVVARARQKGYEYIAVTDHSQSLKIAKGLSLNRLKEQHHEVMSLNKKLDNFRVFTGIEVDILPKGGLDCPDNILKEVDLVVASVHSAFRQDSETMTARIISAVENKNVDIIGHLTGRLITRREGYALDLERVLEAAASCDTILEINSSPARLDLNDVNARMAKEKGLKVAINTDAHDLKRMDEMVYGVAVARRAWLETEDVVNTLSAGALVKYLKDK